MSLKATGKLSDENCNLFGICHKLLHELKHEPLQLPTPNIPLDRIPECQKYLQEGSHRRLYRFGSPDYAEAAGVWSNDEVALPGDPPGPLEIVDGPPEGGKMAELLGNYGAFAPDYAPEEMFEIAGKLYQKGR